MRFDYCCVRGTALREEGYESIVVNSIPKLCPPITTPAIGSFEPLTVEDVLNIVDRTNPSGMIVQFGGQTPLNLAKALEAAGVPIIGTSPDSIDLAEDRERFQKLLAKLGLRQPRNGTATNHVDAARIAEQIGYPVLVRPSYVLGGRNMAIVYDSASLQEYIGKALDAAPEQPILIDKFLEDAIEVDVDAISDGKLALVCGVMEHIEEAGIHSGDSACALPPFSLSSELVANIKQQAYALARELNVIGLMNIQFAVKDGEVYVLEVNPRASRTIPFVSKATGIPWAKLAAKVMIGKSLEELGQTKEVWPRHVSVKESTLPFSRFPGSDIILGPEMRSTGEVMGIDDSFPMAFAKSQLAANTILPSKGKIFISLADRDKAFGGKIGLKLHNLGFQIVSTGGTAKPMIDAGVDVIVVQKLQQGRPNIIDFMKNGEVALIINTPSGRGARTDEGQIRAAAVMQGVPCITTIPAANAAIQAIEALSKGDMNVTPLQEWYRK
ncbi:MAG: carbamoyl-phosphate synthase large subunit [Planctomycetota bacterium]